jgi:hypothetical protein
MGRLGRLKGTFGTSEKPVKNLKALLGNDFEKVMFRKGDF